MGAKPSNATQTDSNQAEDICPARFLRPFRTRESQSQRSGEKEGRTMNPLTQSKTELVLPVLIALALGCFGLSPTARAVDPPPDGGYPNFNTAEGEDALFSLTTGGNNTAVGFDALFSDSPGDRNTAVGSNALEHNTQGVANTATGKDALRTNTTGKANVAVGVLALFNNSTGFRNIAIGNRVTQKKHDRK